MVHKDVILSVTKNPTQKKKTWKEELWEWVKSLVIAFIMAMFIRTFFFQAFKIPSSSMHPTLRIGDHLIANKLVYRFREPERGEIIIFRFPDNTKRDFVKRLVALPGEKVEIAGGQIYINGKAVDDNRINGRYYFNNEGMRETDVPSDSYFVLGDNSANSYDSRYWGFVLHKHLLGKALFIYWPPNRWGPIK
ncbi:MAG: signal peptidase I [Candidatus Omnitrophota bacterium]